MKRPSRILEIGTAVGFSALFMQHYAPAECRIITIEKDRVRAQKARENFARYGRISTEGGQTGITLMEGDAIEVLGGIREDESFDLVFMDAAKGQYIRFLPDAVRLLGSGGLLITDNILQEGEVLSSRFAVTRRNRTIHARMRAYIHALMEEERLETLLLPTGDGAAVSLKK
jgi:predicted O-methyltransferase YrrM